MGLNKKNKKSNLTRLYIVASAFILLSILIGIVVFCFYIKHVNSTTEETEYSQYYVMITDDRKSDFWESVYLGAYERGQEEGIYVELFGDNLSEEYSKLDLMRIAIYSKVDGIIVDADESEEMTNLINEAVQNDIPVITINRDNTQSERCSFVGVGSYNLGREYGRQVLEIAESKAKTSIEVAVLVNAYSQDSGQNILCSGIQETIDKEKKEDVNYNISLVSVDSSSAFSAEEAIRDILTEENLPDIIICLNETNTTCVYQAVVDLNKVGTVDILGYYDSETILKAIDRNVIFATASVDTEQMGRYSIDALKEYYDIGYTSQYFTADISLINRDNVENYLGGDDENEE